MVEESLLSPLLPPCLGAPQAREIHPLMPAALPLREAVLGV